MGKKDRLKRSPSHSNSKIKLSIKELKEYVAATSQDVGIDLSEKSVEGSSDEDQEKTFVAIQDSCEMAKARRSKDLGQDLNQEPTGVDHKKLVNELFPDCSSYVQSSAKWYVDMQARLSSIKNKFTPISEMSVPPNDEDGLPKGDVLPSFLAEPLKSQDYMVGPPPPKEPSKFECFLLEVLQADEKKSETLPFDPKDSHVHSPMMFPEVGLHAPSNGQIGLCFDSLTGDTRLPAPNNAAQVNLVKPQPSVCQPVKPADGAEHLLVSDNGTGRPDGQPPRVQADNPSLLRNGYDGVSKLFGLGALNAQCELPDVVGPFDKQITAEKDKCPSSSAYLLDHNSITRKDMCHSSTALNYTRGGTQGSLSPCLINAQHTPTLAVGPTLSKSGNGISDVMSCPSLPGGGAHANTHDAEGSSKVHSGAVGSPIVSKSDLGQGPIHRSFTQGTTVSGTIKKFNDLFCSVPESVISSEVPGCTSDPVEFPLDFISHGLRSENLTLKVPKELSEQGCNEWVTTLVGYFIGRGLPYSLVKSSTDRLWADFGLFDTLATESGVFFFTFSCAENRDAVLEGGPWYIAGQPIILQPWKPSLRLDKKDVHSLPLWVNLYGIPLELWNPKGISFIASYIGKPLRVDKMTASRRRISYARVCIEVRGDLDLINKFAIETEDENGNTTILDIDVEYQWTPSRCSTCSTFGHDCNKVTTARAGHVNQRAKPSQAGYPTATLKNHNNAQEGVWQVVNRRDKGKHKVSDLHPKPKDVISPGGPTNVGNMFSALSQVIERSDQVAEGSEEAHPLESHLRASSSSQAQLSTPPTSSALSSYDTGNVDCSGNPSGKDLHEMDVITDDSIEAEAVIAFARPMSARQKKKEAKMLFSGSRPKGRH